MIAGFDFFILSGNFASNVAIENIFAISHVNWSVINFYATRKIRIICSVVLAFQPAGQ